MQFFEITATKYGLVQGLESPTPITRALLDLFVSSSSPSASLLEGMVVLWGTEHCYRTAWQYAASFSTSLTTPSTEPHIVALHQALIPNWTSPAFSKFVDATRALVDELANSTTARDGREEMSRCEEVFRQICYLEERFWPDVNGMGEDGGSVRTSTANMNMDTGMNGSLTAQLTNAMNGQMNRSNSGPMGGPMNPNMNGGDGAPVGDGRNSFVGLPNGNGLDNVGQA